MDIIQFGHLLRLDYGYFEPLTDLEEQERDLNVECVHRKWDHVTATPLSSPRGLLLVRPEPYSGSHRRSYSGHTRQPVLKITMGCQRYAKPDLRSKTS